MSNPAVFMSDDDWRVILRELRDSKLKMLETERDYPNHPAIAESARHEATRIAATAERLMAQLTLKDEP